MPNIAQTFEPIKDNGYDESVEVCSLADLLAVAILIYATRSDQRNGYDLLPLRDLEVLNLKFQRNKSETM